MDNYKLKRKVYELFAKNKGYRIADIVNQLDLELPIKKRFTFSFESQIKATIFMRLKDFRSQHQLVDYLSKNDSDAIQLGFGRGDTGKMEIPTRRAFSKFIKNLNKEYLELITSAVFIIKKTADEFNIVLDSVSKNYKKEVSTKTAYNIKEDKIKEVMSLLRNKIYRKLRLDISGNSLFKYPDFIDELIYIALTQDFAENGSKMANQLLGRKMPNADTLFYHLKKFSDWKVLEKTFAIEILDYLIKIAKSRGLISDRKVDVAIDETEWFYYGDRNTPKIMGKKPERGTTWCFKFITIDVINSRSRFTLCALPVLMDDENERTDLVIDLIEFAKLRLRVRRLLADRGFLSSGVINSMNRMSVEIIIPTKENLNMIKNSNNEKAPFVKTNQLMGNCRVNLIVIERDGKRQGFVTNIPLKTSEIELGKVLAEFYRNRWQIETGYRVKEYTFRGKTCSKNYVIRYFYFMLSIILYDCWILADLLIILALGIRTVKTMVTAKIFSAKLLTIKEPAG
jgi:hypothetical protein